MFKRETDQGLKDWLGVLRTEQHKESYKAPN